MAAATALDTRSRMNVSENSDGKPRRHIGSRLKKNVVTAWGRRRGTSRPKLSDTQQNATCTAGAAKGMTAKDETQRVSFAVVGTNQSRLPRPVHSTDATKPTQAAKPRELTKKSSRNIRPVIPVPNTLSGHAFDLASLSVEISEEPLPAGIPDIDSLKPGVADPTLYARELVLHEKEKEKLYRLTPNFLDEKRVGTHMRAILVDWLIQVQNHIGLEQDTLHCCVALLDMFLQRQDVALPKLQLVGIVCLFISTKFLERFPPAVATLIHLTDDTYTHDNVMRMELVILKVLQFDVNVPQPLVFLDRFLAAASATEQMTEISQYLLDLSLTDLSILMYPVSQRAAAAVFLSALISDQTELRALEYYSGYGENELRSCMVRYARLIRKAEKSKYQGARTAYKHERHMNVSNSCLFQEASILAELTAEQE